MLSKEQTEFYYSHYLERILKTYIKNFGTIKWKKPQDLLLKESSRRIPWGEKATDAFIISSAKDKTLLGNDVLERGMYWPFFTIGDYVLLGHHRLESLKLIDADREFLCIELNREHVAGELKYNNNKPLPYTLMMDIPVYFEKPEDSREDEYLILDNDKIINGEFITIEVITYRDMIDILKITPHWIKNYLFHYNIEPSSIINSKEEFDRWLNE